MSAQRALGARLPITQALSLSRSHRNAVLQSYLFRPKGCQQFRFSSSSQGPECHPPQSTASPGPNPTSPTDKKVSRADRILTSTLKYLPHRFHGPVLKFRSAPFSHISAFLLLHELTAIASLGLLMAGFYYFNIVPFEFVFGPWAGVVQEKALKLLRYVRKKGWFGLNEEGVKEGEERLEREVEGEMQKKSSAGDERKWFGFWKEKADVDADGEPSRTSKVMDMASKAKEKVTWDRSEAGYKIGVQLFAAYGITKALLIPRIALSIWLTPPTARMFIFCREVLKRVLRW